MKRYSTSSAIRQMKIKVAIKYHFIYNRMGRIKELDNDKSVRKDVEHLEPPHTAGGCVQQCSHFGKQPSSSLKRSTVTIWSSSCTPRYPLKRNENMFAQNTVCKCSQPCYSQQPKSAKQPKCPSTDKWINAMWYSHKIASYSTMKTLLNEVLTQATTRMSLETRC